VTRRTIGGRVDSEGLAVLIPRCAACDARGSLIEAVIESSSGTRTVVVCKACAAAAARDHASAASLADRILGSADE
jgi:hypothetical protein